MKSPILLEVPRAPGKRDQRRKETATLKLKSGIQTHVARLHYGKRNWIALSMPAACARLKGYDLTEAQKTTLFEMVAGYCRLLDECGLLVDGFKTEYEAVKDAAKAAEGAQ